MPKKTLITEARVLEAARRGATTLSVPPDVLITALAHDAARDHGVRFVEETPEPAYAAFAPQRPRIVAFGSDHAGFSFKAPLMEHARSLGWEPLDLGTHSEQRCDYPTYALAVAEAVRSGRAGFGVMIDGAGIGSAMAAGKVPGIRAACAYSAFTAFNARAHNDAHVLTLGSRALGIETCKSVLKVFLETPFEGGRHADRVAIITEAERRFGVEG